MPEDFKKTLSLLKIEIENLKKRGEIIKSLEVLRCDDSPLFDTKWLIKKFLK